MVLGPRQEAGAEPVGIVYELARTEELLIADSWARRLGIGVEAVAADALTLAVTLAPKHLNFLGGGHGGVLFTLAQTAATVAVRQRGAAPVLVDSHLVLTGGGRQGDTWLARVSDVNVGRSLAVLEVAVRRDDNRLVGRLTATFRFGP